MQWSTSNTQTSQAKNTKLNTTTMPDESYENDGTLFDSKGTSAESSNSENDDRREDDDQVDYYELDDRDHQL
jgi:hypothetical protein